MPEPTWHPVRVPPLRADTDRFLRDQRRALRRFERSSKMFVSALIGFAGGALAALPPGSFA